MVENFALKNPFEKFGFGEIPDREGWIRSIYGNIEAERVPIREDEEGWVWIDNIKIISLQDTEYLYASKMDKEIMQAPRVIKLNGRYEEIWEDYLKSEAYRSALKNGGIFVTPNLSKEGNRVQAVKSKENDAICDINYIQAKEVAYELGYGSEWEERIKRLIWHRSLFKKNLCENVGTRLLRDAEYSLWYIHKMYNQCKPNDIKNNYSLWLDDGIYHDEPDVAIAPAIKNEEDIRDGKRLIYDFRWHENITLKATLTFNPIEN